MMMRDFCYWLQGYMELNTDKSNGLTPEQTQTVQNHLNLVFQHDIDPSLVKKTGVPAADAAVVHSGNAGIHPNGGLLLRC